MNPTIYPITDLVDKLYDELSGKQTSQKIILENPIIKVENKKTYVINFTSICYKLKRNVEDVKKYFEKEMTVVASISGSGSLTITGMFKVPQIMKIFTNFIEDNVRCKECKSCDTEIIKENRITYNSCNKCKSRKAF